MARGDEDDLLSKAMELLRSRLPGRSEVELRSIVEEEFVRVQVRAIIARSGNRSARLARDEDC